jgi:hypothetical protein
MVVVPLTFVSIAAHQLGAEKDKQSTSTFHGASVAA